MDPWADYRQSNLDAARAKYQRRAYDDRYIAFLDVLGMRNWVRKAYSDVSSIFQIVEATRLDYSQASLASGRPIVSNEQLNVTVMSDSIVVSIDVRTENAFSKMIGFCSCVIQDLIKRPDNPIFVRGGIVRGEIYHCGEIVFGPGLVEAYRLESEVAKSMRCIVSPELCEQREIQKYIEENGSKLRRDESDGFRFVNFIRADNVKCLRNEVSKILKTTEDVKIRSKYMWLDQHLQHLFE